MKILKIIGLLALVSTLGVLGFKFYHFYVEFPEEARMEILNQRYAGLIGDLNKAVMLSDSADSLANELENIQYPPGTRKYSNDYIEILFARETPETTE